MESVLEDVRPARPGVTHPSRPGGWTGFLSDVVVELGYIDAETSEWAVEEGRVNGKAVTDVLLEAELIGEDQLSRATAELHGLDHVDLGTFELDLDVARLISSSAARRYAAVPIAFEDDGTLLIALADPADPLAVDDISVMTKSEVHPMIATPSSIAALIEQLADSPSGPASQEAPVPSAPSAPEAPRVVPEPVAEPPAEPAAPAQPGRASHTEPVAQPESRPGPVADAAPDPYPAAADGEMAQMRQALADLAARVESFTAPPAEPAAAPEPSEPSISAEEHDAVFDRLQAAERRASEADGALEQLAEAERRANEAEAALAEVRSERDQERLRHQKAEEELRAQIESAKESARRLEQRLSNVLAVAAEIRTACEKLVSAETPASTRVLSPR